MQQRPHLYVAITNHGFGHATRTAAVLAELHRLRPDVRFTVATQAPRWLLASYFGGDFEQRPVALDVGVVQSDSLQIDRTATWERLQHLQAQQDSLIEQEAAYLQQEQVQLVLADIPPLAIAIAAKAQLPCWMMGNFGWDFIYADWGHPFVEIVDWIRHLYKDCDRLFRLPFHEPMQSFPVQEAVGLTGGSPQFSDWDLRQRFDLSADAKTVLLTFGGLGLQQFPYDTLQAFPDWQFLSFDRQAPDLPNLRTIRDPIYRPVDFMPICDWVFCKPGYGTFSEACRVQAPIASLTRTGFAEAELLLQSLQTIAPHAILSPEACVAGDWSVLKEPPQPPLQELPWYRDGNRQIAEAIAEALN
ncbi:hypothetical protein [Synechococcus elongatus]|uniref:Glycosyl transferase n=2 Tax=Synechococcus elongatus TaxID=32046 RepID=Q31JZ1_SYNE7|nr:hypothetical protein [Synechococcus elongatus]ABB58628.1 conserved hypothetical protein [Synechococcus elongatus PCC 7942 = FACHB-805]AJD56919.1 hypothetical protein M744_03180 [Synechococcus elongatus UTEX 2973]MBD2587849.1 glycosyl transferase [Synechococcus elongatus FACHB-242]MBD2688917.1 glycosyl transferase [Synechococcus elongatus FACHB-1061]MBD2707443.1 glycosyl transferase [Synechococcus elongatus PCC 7942 = FACHB-805]